MIKLHWWRTSKRRGNFGDELSRFLCEQLSHQWTDWAPLEQAELVAAGSLLATHLNPGFRWSSFEGWIWGTGCMLEGESVDLGQARVAALRGHLSLAQVQCRNRENVILGDPGLLVHTIIRGTPREHYQLGIMPHWSEMEHPFYRDHLAQLPGLLWISPFDHVDNIIEKITSCQHLLTSSLHGLIAADAFQIPNRWLRLNTGQENTHGSTLFKFRDYYSVFGIDQIQPASINDCLTIDDILDQMKNYHRPGLANLQQSLKQAFPFSFQYV